MTPGALARRLFDEHPDVTLTHLAPADSRHEPVRAALRDIAALAPGLLVVEDAGHSLEGRSIPLVSLGRGPLRVLLWSQMHGDEPTATLALLDMLHYLARHTGEEPWIEAMLRELTVHIVPVLNPDGAERFQRRTAAGIDMNRDAGAQATPEATLLRALHRRCRPRFGFNLHDQELSSVGDTTRVTAMALLAPALDVRRTMPPVRLRAARVAALIARSLTPFAARHLARYNDTHEPRAFGDAMQKWGTSTVLIESGHWPDDPKKQFIRRLNFVAISTALSAIGNGAYQDTDLDHYAGLPENGKRIFDIIVRNLVLRHESGTRIPVDAGLMREPVHNHHAPAPVVTVKDVGDLSTFGALTTIDGGRREIGPESLALERVLPLARFLDELQLYHAG
jgi:hypothetical protein